MRWLERLLVLLATAATLVVNGLAGNGALGGVTTGEVAGRFALPFTPAGYVFAIWGLIYVGLVAFSLYQVAGAGAASGRVALLRPVYVFSAAANVAWLVLWHRQAPLAALCVMLLLLASLAVARRQLATGPAASRAEAWCVDLPFRLYLSWITVATLANLAVVLAYAGAVGVPRAAEPISLAMLALAFFLAAIGYRRGRDPVFLVVIAWAAAGIALRHGQPMTVSVPAMGVAALAGLGAISLLLEDARDAEAQSTTR